MKAKRLLGLLMAAAILLIATTSTSAQVATVNNIAGVASVSGQIARIQAPASVEQGELEDDNRAFIFLEKENFRLREILRVNVRGTGTFNTTGSISGGSISSGTEVNSYFIHFDRIGQFANLGGVSGSITFDQDILGLILLTNNINLTTPDFRAIRTLYGTGHGLEFSSQQQLSQDSVTISTNRRTLSFDLQNNVQTDQIRVITLETNSTQDGGSNNGGGGNNNGSTGNCNNPTASNDSATTERNRSVTINVLDNDDDSNNNVDNCTITIDADPSDGTVSVNNTNETITYTPRSGFTGTDRFDYEICDSGNDCSTARVTITVTSSSSGDGSGSGSGSGDDDDGSRVTLRTLLPEADDCSAADEARIDIVPGNRENMIRLDDEEGYTPVAILSSEDFPAPNCIDVSTVMFGPEGSTDFPALSCGVVNVNFDRWKDIICDFKTSDLGFSTDDSMGELSADTIENDVIDERDDVMVIGVRRIKNFLPPRRGSNSVDSLSVKTMQMGQSMFVLAQATDVAQTSVKIFNAQGQLLQSASAQGSLLRVKLTMGNGAQLANGVYFAVVTSLDSKGNVIGHELTKIAILR